MTLPAISVPAFVDPEVSDRIGTVAVWPLIPTPLRSAPVRSHIRRPTASALTPASAARSPRPPTSIGVAAVWRTARMSGTRSDVLRGNSCRVLKAHAASDGMDRRKHLVQGIRRDVNPGRTGALPAPSGAHRRRHWHAGPSSSTPCRTADRTTAPTIPRRRPQWCR